MNTVGGDTSPADNALKRQQSVPNVSSAFYRRNGVAIQRPSISPNSASHPFPPSLHGGDGTVVDELGIADLWSPWRKSGKGSVPYPSISSQPRIDEELINADEDILFLLSPLVDDAMRHLNVTLVGKTQHGRSRSIRSSVTVETIPATLDEPVKQEESNRLPPSTANLEVELNPALISANGGASAVLSASVKRKGSSRPASQASSLGLGAASEKPSLVKSKKKFSNQRPCKAVEDSQVTGPNDISLSSNARLGEVVWSLYLMRYPIISEAMKMVLDSVPRNVIGSLRDSLVPELLKKADTALEIRLSVRTWSAHLLDIFATDVDSLSKEENDDLGPSDRSASNKHTEKDSECRPSSNSPISTPVKAPSKKLDGGVVNEGGGDDGSGFNVKGNPRLRRTESTGVPIELRSPITGPDPSPMSEVTTPRSPEEQQVQKLVLLIVRVQAEVGTAITRQLDLMVEERTKTMCRERSTALLTNLVPFDMDKQVLQLAIPRCTKDCVKRVEDFVPEQVDKFFQDKLASLWNRKRNRAVKELKLEIRSRESSPTVHVPAVVKVKTQTPPSSHSPSGLLQDSRGSGNKNSKSNSPSDEGKVVSSPPLGSPSDSPSSAGSSQEVSSSQFLEHVRDCPLHQLTRLHTRIRSGVEPTSVDGLETTVAYVVCKLMSYCYYYYCYYCYCYCFCCFFPSSPTSDIDLSNHLSNRTSPSLLPV